MIGNGNDRSSASFNDENCDTANGYGVLIGYDFAGARNSSASVMNNILTITDSTINGNGSGNSNGYYSGNGYGALIGFSGGSAVSGGSFTVASNNIAITNSKLMGTGINESYGSYTANGYGLLVGYGIAGNLGSVDISIANNTINIVDSILEGDGNAASYGRGSGSGYGLAVGYGSYLGFGERSITQNTVNVTGSEINAVTNDITGSAYGINIGLHGKSSASGVNNLTVEDDIFTINANNRGGWGIWLDPDVTTNTLQLVGNNTFNGENIGHGGEIMWPDGSVWNWV